MVPASCLRPSASSAGIAVDTREAVVRIATREEKNEPDRIFLRGVSNPPPLFDLGAADFDDLGVLVVIRSQALRKLLGRHVHGIECQLGESRGDLGMLERLFERRVERVDDRSRCPCRHEAADPARKFITRNGFREAICVVDWTITV